MRSLFLVLVLLLLAGLAIPVSAADTNRMGYLTIEGVTIGLHDTGARIEVTYTTDPGMHLIFLLFGTGDLQRKLEKALSFPSLKAEEVGLDHAVFTAEDAAEYYGDRAYWFPAHSFGITFPLVKVEAPGYSLSYTRASSIPKGFGYFGDNP
jgi:hypothetical protein